MRIQGLIYKQVISKISRYLKVMYTLHCSCLGLIQLPIIPTILVLEKDLIVETYHRLKELVWHW